MRRFLLVAGCLIAGATISFSMELYPGEFKAGRLDGWKAKRFAGETQYSLVEIGNKLALEGLSKASASALFKEVGINVKRYPYLNWSWMTTRLLENNNERKKSGDDFSLRLYVLVSTGPFFWQTKALSYVWSGYQPVGASWPNPFGGNPVMVAVESGDTLLNQWVTYKRNIREDLKRYLNLDMETVQAVALMVDTDNTGQYARSYFGDIFFTRE